jgi:hypothetical protein
VWIVARDAAICGFIAEDKVVAVFLPFRSDKIAVVKAEDEWGS